MKDLIKLSENEDAFIAVVMRGSDQDSSAVIPDNMEPRSVLMAVQRCTSVLVKLERGQGYIVPILGRLMARVAKDQLWGMAGYDTLEGYERAEIEGKGVAHSTLWAAKQAFTVFPSLPLDRYASIGPKKLATAASVASKLNYEPAQKEELLREAENTPSVDAFRRQSEKRLGGDSAGALQGACYQLFGSKSEIDDFKERLADGRAIEFAGSSLPIKMVLAWESEASSVYPVERRKGDTTIHYKPKADQETEF